MARILSRMDARESEDGTAFVDYLDYEMAQVRIRELEQRLAELQWREITEQDLPKAEHEVIRWRKDILGDFEQVLSVVDLFEWACTDYVAWKAAGWTHFRPKNPPARADEAKG